MIPQVFLDRIRIPRTAELERVVLFGQQNLIALGIPAAILGPIHLANIRGITCGAPSEPITAMYVRSA